MTYTAADTIELLRGYRDGKNGLPMIEWETAIWRAGWKLAHNQVEG